MVYTAYTCTEYISCGGSGRQQFAEWIGMTRLAMFAVNSADPNKWRKIELQNTFYKQRPGL